MKKNSPEIHEILSNKKSFNPLKNSAFVLEISKKSIFVLGVFIFLVFLLLLSQVFSLQIIDGDKYTSISSNNTFTKSIIFAERGKIFDRNNKLIVDNIKSEDKPYPLRSYPGEAFGHLIGYVGYPKKDTSDNFYQEDIIGETGVEKIFDKRLSGSNGATYIERNAKAEKLTEHFYEPSRDGLPLTLSIDKDIQEKLYSLTEEIVKERNIQGAGIALMDVNSGEILSLVSYPGFNSNYFVDRKEEKIQEYLKDDRSIFLNRAVSGLYTPGSTVKPFFALAALEEEIISPNKYIVSNGYIRIKNPYAEDDYTQFNDWKVHGATNIKEALAVSSNVYFYTISGGFADQEGFGISKLYEYAKIFGLENKTNTLISQEPFGNIPNPEWKEKVFGEEWRLGDTYNTAIGQYGFQITPLQLLRAISSIANGGKLVEPKILYGPVPEYKKLAFKNENLEIVREGMRLAVLDGTAVRLDVPYVQVAAKTGTAEIGKTGKVNSLVIGFFPYQNPKYAFSVIMEKGVDTENQTTGTHLMRDLLDWMNENKSEYLQ